MYKDVLHTVQLTLQNCSEKLLYFSFINRLISYFYGDIDKHSFLLCSSDVDELYFEPGNQ